MWLWLGSNQRPPNYESNVQSTAPRRPCKHIVDSLLLMINEYGKDYTQGQQIIGLWEDIWDLHCNEIKRLFLIYSSKGKENTSFTCHLTYISCVFSMIVSRKLKPNIVQRLNYYKEYVCMCNTIVIDRTIPNKQMLKS